MDEEGEEEDDEDEAVNALASDERSVPASSSLAEAGSLLEPPVGTAWCQIVLEECRELFLRSTCANELLRRTADKDKRELLLTLLSLRDRTLEEQGLTDDMLLLRNIAYKDENHLTEGIP